MFLCMLEEFVLSKTEKSRFLLRIGNVRRLLVSCMLSHEINKFTN